MNRPEIGFDYSNFNLNDVSFIGTGLKERQDIIEPLKQSLEKDTDRQKFFFIEIFNPGHINTREERSLGVEGERQLWKESMERANVIIYKTVDLIKEKDPNALIIILADHGGGVGLEYTNQTYSIIEDEAIIYSLFTSTLAIHWPDGIAPEFDDLFKSNVNVFRILFSYLGEEEKYLEELQENGSYIVINKKAPKGIYQYIDDSGKVTFKKV